PLHAGAVPLRKLGLRVDDPALAGARPGHEQDAWLVAGTDEAVGRSGRAVEEVPRPQPSLLALDERDALAGQHEEVLLPRVGVVEAARPAGMQDGQLDPE